MSLNIDALAREIADALHPGIAAHANLHVRETAREILHRHLPAPTVVEVTGQMIYEAMYAHCGGLWRAVDEAAQDDVWNAAASRLNAAITPPLSATGPVGVTQAITSLVMAATDYGHALGKFDPVDHSARLSLRSLVDDERAKLMQEIAALTPSLSVTAPIAVTQETMGRLQRVLRHVETVAQPHSIASRDATEFARLCNRLVVKEPNG